MSKAAEDWARSVLKDAVRRGLRLTSSTQLLLKQLAWHHNAVTEACFPSMQTLAAEVGVSDRQARTLVRKLESLGLIKSSRRRGQGKNSSNQYQLFGLLPAASTFASDAVIPEPGPVRNSSSAKRILE